MSTMIAFGGGFTMVYVPHERWVVGACLAVIAGILLIHGLARLLYRLRRRTKV